MYLICFKVILFSCMGLSLAHLGTVSATLCTHRCLLKYWIAVLEKLVTFFCLKILLLHLRGVTNGLEHTFGHRWCSVTVSLRLDKVHKCYRFQTDGIQSRPIILVDCRHSQ